MGESIRNFGDPGFSGVSFLQKKYKKFVWAKYVGRAGFCGLGCFPYIITVNKLKV